MNRSVDQSHPLTGTPTHTQTQAIQFSQATIFDDLAEIRNDGDGSRDGRKLAGWMDGWLLLKMRATKSRDWKVGLFVVSVATAAAAAVQ